MNPVQPFMKYAAAFEETFADDDWTRLGPYFTPDATYTIESDRYAAQLEGPDAIFAGMKRSLDGLDRRYSGREIAVTDGPHVEGDTLRADWSVTYTREGWTPYVLRGRTTATLAEDGRIAALVDAFDAETTREIDAWMRVERRGGRPVLHLGRTPSARRRSAPPYR